MPADGGVGQPGVVRGHGVRVMVQDAPDDLLRDVTVDQPGAQRVPPLVGGQVRRLAVLVADVAASQPAVERLPVGGCAVGAGAVQVRVDLREQDRWPAGPSRQGPALLLGDQPLEFFVDGDQGLAFHLVVVVAQVGGCVRVVHDAVAGEFDGVGDPQSAADEDERDQVPHRVAPQAEAGRVLDLGHDVLGEGAGKPGPVLGIVLGEDRGAGGQGVVPAVLPDCEEESAQLADVVTVGFGAGERCVQVGQVALDDLPVQMRQVAGGGGQERGEPADRADALGCGIHGHAGAQPPPCPPLGQFLQPGLGNLVEPDGGLRRVDVQLAQPPHVAGVFDLPAAAAGEVFDMAARVKQQGGRPPALGSRRDDTGPGFLRPVQQRCHLGARQGMHRGLRDDRHDLGLPLVAAPLQRVLDFQLELCRQPLQVDMLTPGRDVLFAHPGVLAGRRASLRLPAAVVSTAERAAALGPDTAVGDPAGQRHR